MKIIGFITNFFRLFYLALIMILYRNKIALGLERLGPAYIKLGQFLSTRPDIIGNELASSFAYLRDNLSGFDFREVKKIIEREKKQPLEELFSFFSTEPVAAASIAQVHKAITIDGREVAVKIRRPGIKKKLLREVDFFYFLVRVLNFLFTKSLRRLKLLEVVKKIESSFRYELDLKLEAAAADELRENNKLDYLIVPAVDWLLTSERMLTLEWIEATSIYDFVKLKEEKVNIKELTTHFAITFLSQAFDYGFFHADPHQGNILVTKEGKIALVDFGIVGRLDRKNRIYVARILHGFIKRDYDLLAELHLKAGYIKENCEVGLFKQNLRAIGEQIMNLPAEKISMANLLGQLFKITEEFDMEIQPQLLFLQKTMIMIEGIGKTLSPQENLWVLAEDWIQNWAKRNLAIEAKLAKTIKKIINKIIDTDNI